MCISIWSEIYFCCIRNGTSHFELCLFSTLAFTFQTTVPPTELPSMSRPTWQQKSAEDAERHFESALPAQRCEAEPGQPRAELLGASGSALQPPLTRDAELHREPAPSSQPPAPAMTSSTSKTNLLLNINDIAQLLQTFIRLNSHINYDKFIIPTFDLAQQNQRIEGWIAKVNECAKMYNWTDEQTTHYALPKLGGHSKKWYEGLHTILLTWSEWQVRLIKTFPSESDFGVLLSDMLERRMKFGESVDSFEYTCFNGKEQGHISVPNQ